MSRRCMRMGRVEVVVRFAGDLFDVVEVPVGTTVRIGTTAVRAIAGTEATVGHVTVTITAATATAKQDVLPRPRNEARPYIYGTASLLAQLAIVVVAFWTATSVPV